MQAIYDEEYYFPTNEELARQSLANVMRVQRVNEQLRCILAVVRSAQKFFFEKTSQIYSRSSYRYLEEYEDHRLAVHNCMQSLGRARKLIASGNWSRAVAYISRAIAAFYVILDHGWPINYQGTEGIALQSRAMRSAMREARTKTHLLIDLYIVVNTSQY